MWKYPDDHTAPVLTAKAHIESNQRWDKGLVLPETAVLFFMSGGVEYLQENYPAELLDEKFPRFLSQCPIYALKESGICFLNGGSGAPMAADTLETLAVLGVKKVVAVGMFGAFSGKVACGEVIVPQMAFVEEGTSLHYYGAIEFAEPDQGLRQALASKLGVRSYPVISTDAVYRQTFFKEQLWREKGAVGVDMETSVLFSVGKYLGLQTAAILIASDRHPLAEADTKWEWRITREQKAELFEKSLHAVLES
ncbi:MAG: nucleoside phosphorylase [Oscillospiraceae bacterium]|nr:nucleoside phosphorylase [Oscillospiraceae bacterium]